MVLARGWRIMTFKQDSNNIEDFYSKRICGSRNSPMTPSWVKQCERRRTERNCRKPWISCTSGRKNGGWCLMLESAKSCIWATTTLLSTTPWTARHWRRPRRKETLEWLCPITWNQQHSVCEQQKQPKPSWANSHGHSITETGTYSCASTSNTCDHTSNSPLKLGPHGLKETGAVLRKFNREQSRWYQDSKATSTRSGWENWTYQHCWKDNIRWIWPWFTRSSMAREGWTTLPGLRKQRTDWERQGARRTRITWEWSMAGWIRGEISSAYVWLRTGTAYRQTWKEWTIARASKPYIEPRERPRWTTRPDERADGSRTDESVTSRSGRSPERPYLDHGRLHIK